MVQQLLRLARLESGLEQEEEEIYSLHELFATGLLRQSIHRGASQQAGTPVVRSRSQYARLPGTSKEEKDFFLLLLQAALQTRQTKEAAGPLNLFRRVSP